jgi:hypothetical protein
MNAKTDTLYHSYLTSIALMNPKHVDWYETTALLIAPSFIHKTKKMISKTGALFVPSYTTATGYIS